MEVKNKLSFLEELSFIDLVVSKCFDENSLTGEYEYKPELKEFWIGVYTVYFYTEENLIDGDYDIDVIFEKVTNKEYMENIFCKINQIQYTRIKYLIDEKIQDKTQKLIHDTGLGDLCKTITSILHKLDGSLSAETIQSILPALKTLSTISDVTPEDAINLIVDKITKNKDGDDNAQH